MPKLILNLDDKEERILELYKFYDITLYKADWKKEVRTFYKNVKLVNFERDKIQIEGDSHYDDRFRYSYDSSITIYTNEIEEIKEVEK